MSDLNISPSSRYQRVKTILNTAAEGGDANYQGYGKFWERPLEQFLNVEIYGIRMIAPGPDASSCPVATPPKSGCCHHAPKPAVSSPQSNQKCSAASGLIKGLYGQYPFDGNQFPRLPWGGKAVAVSDIDFIATWIDDGCPAEDACPDSHGLNAQRRAKVLGDEAHPLATTPINALRNDNSAPIVRKNINSLSPDELQRYCAAVAKMHTYDQFFLDERSFNWWARIHANNCQHGWEEFLPWHRLYLYYFEQALRDIDPTVAIPYWDWTDNYDQDQTAVTPDSGIIPEVFRCWIDAQSLINLQDKIPGTDLDKLRAIEGQTYNSGNRLLVAAGIAYEENSAETTAILSELQRVNPLWHAKRWPGGNNNLLFEDYPDADDIEHILSIGNFFNFGSGPSANHFFGALENIHNLIHNFSGGVNPANPKEGGDMGSPGTTAYDPIFWSHHSNVDRLWAEWQERHPGINPDNPNAALPPWMQNVQETLSIATFGYEYMKAAHYYPTDNNLGMVRFTSAPAQTPAHVLAKHRKAEVRLHHIKYAQRGGLVRVFLNQPGADATTPTRSNPGFVGQFHLFMGSCVGGEGHCAEPPDQKRPFDHRPRHRKTPSHLRFDATAAVQRLIAQGASDFTVQVVTLDTQGQPADDVLFLRGVALNFFD